MTVEPSVGSGKTRANARVDANTSEASAALPCRQYLRLLPGTALTIISLHARCVAGTHCRVLRRICLLLASHRAVGATQRGGLPLHAARQRPALAWNTSLMAGLSVAEPRRTSREHRQLQCAAVDKLEAARGRCWSDSPDARCREWRERLAEITKPRIGT